jgi:hypothetical protein
MTVNRTTLLNLPLPVTGTESGLWGDYTNNGFTEYVDTAVAGALSITASITLANTTGTNSATGITTTTAQYRTLVVPAAGVSANVVITAPSSNRTYHVINRNATYTVQIRAGANSGVTLGVNQSATVAYNTVAADYVLVGTIGPTVPVANGGTGLTSGTSGGVLYYSATGTLASSGALAASSLVLGGGAGAAPTTTTTGSGVVTALGNATNAASGVPVLNASGLLAIAQGGTNSSATATAGGVGYGTGTAHAYTSAGTAGYVLQSNGSSAPTWVAPSTGTVTAVSVATSNGFAGSSSGGATPALTLSTTITGVLKGNGTAISAATAGTDYVAPGTATTFTALQTFSGSATSAATKLTNAKEVATVSATAATGTITYNVTTQSVLYYTTNASANWTVNFTVSWNGSTGTKLDDIMSTGESMTVAFLVTQGSTAYYNSTVQVDGSSVTPKYQGGTAWSAGNASSIDVYSYTIIKTASATFTVLASQTKFA